MLSFSIQLDQNLESKDIPSKLAEFKSICVYKSNIRIVQNLKMLKAKIDNQRDDKLSTPK